MCTAQYFLTLHKGTSHPLQTRAHAFLGNIYPDKTYFVLLPSRAPIFFLKKTILRGPNKHESVTWR